MLSPRAFASLIVVDCSQSLYSMHVQTQTQTHTHEHVGMGNYAFEDILADTGMPHGMKQQR